MKFVDSDYLLGQLVNDVAETQWVAIDTEADSLHHYREKLCLVQISAESGDFVIDPLAGLDLQPLLNILKDKFLILHGADFDIRTLKKSHTFFPKKIFDTMIAAQVLGYPKIGLADLVHRHCGMALSKSAQKADWSERPLTEELLDYAQKDTRYLRAVQQAMETELRGLGRLAWHEESCQKLLRSLELPSDAPDDEPRWQVKGSKELTPRARTFLKELWFWRESEAEKKDRPPFKILRSENLLSIARWAQKEAEPDLALCPFISKSLIPGYRDALNAAFGKARSAPPPAHVSKKPKMPRRFWTEKQLEKIAELKEKRDKIAAELQIQPSVLATQAMIESIVASGPTDMWMGWQRELLCRDS